MTKPQPTAVILGANAERNRFYNKSVRAHLKAGYTVYPVHPREKEVEGLPVFPNLDAVPRPIDRVSLYIPPAAGLQLVDPLARTEAREVWLNPGTESPELIRALQDRHINVIVGCSIVDLGFSPSQFPG